MAHITGIIQAAAAYRRQSCHTLQGKSNQIQENGTFRFSCPYPQKRRETRASCVFIALFLPHRLRTFGFTPHTMIFFHTSGKKEQLNLSVEGLPEKVTGSFSPQSGIPTFTGVLRLKANDAIPGIYKLKISSATERDSIKTFDVPLRVVQTCDKEMVGEYYNQCDPAINTIITLSNKRNMVLIKKFFDTSNASAYLNCTDNTITIPYMSVLASVGYPGYLVSAKGSFTDNTITLEATILVDAEQKQYEYRNCILTRK
jgi:hypothetical protein